MDFTHIKIMYIIAYIVYCLYIFRTHVLYTSCSNVTVSRMMNRQQEIYFCMSSKICLTISNCMVLNFTAYKMPFTLSALMVKVCLT